MNGKNPRSEVFVHFICPCFTASEQSILDVCFSVQVSSRVWCELLLTQDRRVTPAYTSIHSNFVPEPGFELSSPQTSGLANAFTIRSRNTNSISTFNFCGVATLFDFLENQRKTRGRGLHLLDRGSYAYGRTAKMISDHFLVLKVYPCKYSDLCSWQFCL